MSEEESFVILGSSPTDSMENYSIIQKLSGQKGRENVSNQASLDHAVNGADKELSGAGTPKRGSLETDGVPTLASDGATSTQEDIPASVVFINSSTQDGKSPANQPNGATAGQLNFEILASKNMNGSLLNSDHNSLATSFLLGEVESDVLKASVFSQFPSLCGSQTAPEDIIKLQRFFSEYLVLKSNMHKTNATLKEQLIYMQKFQGEYEAFKEQSEVKTKQCYEIIAKLNNEIVELKQDLNDKINIIENVMKKENDDLVKLLSEKTAVIKNMGVHLEKVEQSQLASFEYVKLNEGDKDSEHEYVRSTEHKRVVNDITRQLSEVTAAKLELEDMKKIYIDEINCLKVNLTAAEELIKSNQAEISILKSKDIEKSDLFQKYDGEKEEMKQEINLLRAQLDVYRKDFEMERNLRQSLAGEKDQLLTDLKMLQRRNQQFIEELAARRVENETKRDTASLPTSKRRSTASSSSTSSTNSSRMHPVAAPLSDVQVYTRSNFECPLCRSLFKNLNTLQDHVQDCLDKA